MKYLLLTLFCSLHIYTHAGGNGWLIDIATTTRISAQHYSEMVCDNMGYVYIASYVKDTLKNVDDIYIVKVSPEGEKIWEKGIGNHGRAISISIDSKQRLWVTGYFANRLTLDEQYIKCKEVAGFIATIDTSGICTQLSAMPDGTDMHNIHINNNDDILITGTYANSLKLGKQKIETNRQTSGFVAIYNNDGDAVFLGDIQAYVTDVTSDTNGSFYLTGSFAELFLFQGSELYTQSYLDKDGFLLKLSNEGELLWLNQTGKVGEVSEFYTSHDMGCDLAIDDEQRIILPVIEDSTYEDKALIVNIYDNDDGDLLKSKKLCNILGASGGVSIEVVKGKYYLSLLAKDRCWFDGKFQMYVDDYEVIVAELDKNLNITNVISGESDESYMIRESTSYKNTIYFSGHYKSKAHIDQYRLTGNGKYALFLYKLNIAK
ncbi:MAG: hypothetical protein H6551_04480 [Chitinophagales bacterium]|nr:hypothetical protein [Chitinophagaceae bacterium]MCB9064381.1 hypothetical protein [Chitinophagales bacterium]